MLGSTLHWRSAARNRPHLSAPRGWLDGSKEFVVMETRADRAGGARPNDLTRSTLCMRALDVRQSGASSASGDEEPAAAERDPVLAAAAQRYVRVIGMGARGISAMKRLSGAVCAQDTELWAIDSDKKVLGSIPAGSPISVIELQASDDTVLSNEHLQCLAGDSPPLGQGAAPPNQGVAFVLGSAFGSPGGSSLMLQLVNFLRRCGYFVAVALTRPFAFEGARKLEQADALIEAMEDVASMVVVIDQNVLTRASSELTMHEASAIADNTLECTVRSLMSALRAPEVLKVTKGAFLWHGRDLRLMKRPLFPPMMHLVTCPGVGNLGRGQASIPLESLQQARLPSALSTLAEDAVKAAAESPFLEGKVASSTAVLCVLLLPRSVMDVGAMGAFIPGLTDHQREYAVRSAIQVAALAVQDAAGPQCTDIIVCPQVCEEGHPAAAAGGGADPSASEGMLTLECAILALQAIEEAAGTAGKSSAQQPAAPSPSTSAATNPLSRLDLEKRRLRPPQRHAVEAAGQAQAATSARSPMPATVARAVSVGTSNGSTSSSGPNVRPAEASSSSGSTASVTGGAAAAGSGATPTRVRTRVKTNWSAMSMIAGGSAAAAPGAGGAAAAQSRLGAAGSRGLEEQVGRLGLPTRQQQQSPPPSASRAPLTNNILPTGPMRIPPEQIPRMADNLVTSLVAQSLDLPPSAARWRHQQRKASTATHAGGHVYQLPEAQDLREGAKQDVRARVAGMLENERD